MQVDVLGVPIEFTPREGVFSPGAPDAGTLAMLRAARIQPGAPEKVLDLGCGWGLVGVLAAQISGAENVWMCDVNPVAIETARKNAAANGAAGVHLCLSDGLAGVDTAGFDLILSNPPYQTDFSVAKSFIEKGFNRLKIGGWMYLVVKREAWYRNKMRAVFGGVELLERDGYLVLRAQRRAARRSNAR